MAINFHTTFNFPNAIRSMNANPNPCPDQFVGSVTNGIFTYKPRVDIDYDTTNKKITNTLMKPIVIILESPHKDEFDPITRIARGPAMGRSGTNFGNFFSSLLGNSKLMSVLSKSLNDVVFVNAIQYQCSLGNKLSGKGSYQNKKRRDLNWITCYNINSADLTDRITAIAPFAVINLCTIGTQNLQLYVDRITNTFNNYTIGNHPSTWNYGKGVIQ